MIFSQSVLHFGQAVRQGVDGNLTGFFIDTSGFAGSSRKKLFNNAMRSLQQHMLSYCHDRIIRAICRAQRANANPTCMIGFYLDHRQKRASIVLRFLVSLRGCAADYLYDANFLYFEEHRLCRPCTNTTIGSLSSNDTRRCAITTNGILWYLVLFLEARLIGPRGPSTVCGIA